MTIAICKSCNGEFNKQYPSDIRVYCSKSCANRETSLARHKRESFGFTKGDRRITGQNSFSWKGDKVGIAGLHDWVKKNLGLASECVNCNDTLGAARFEWANISGEYKRDLSDWMMLCSICHRRYDNNTAKAWITRRLFT